MLYTTVVHDDILGVYGIGGLEGVGIVEGSRLDGGGLGEIIC